MRLLALLGTLGCTDLGGAPPDGTIAPDVFPDGGASLGEDVQPLFTQRCVLSGCHGSAGAAFGLILVEGMARSHLVDVAAAGAPGHLRVAAGHPERSYLVNKLEGTQLDVGGDGRRMPLGQQALAPDEIDRVVRWIRSGARDNF